MDDPYDLRSVNNCSMFYYRFDLGCFFELASRDRISIKIRGLTLAFHFQVGNS